MIAGAIRSEDERIWDEMRCRSIRSCFTITPGSTTRVHHALHPEAPGAEGKLSNVEFQSIKNVETNASLPSASGPSDTQYRCRRQLLICLKRDRNGANVLSPLRQGHEKPALGQRVDCFAPRRAAIDPQHQAPPD